MNKDAVIIVNPLVVANIKNKRFFELHEPTMAREDWVKANAITILQDGSDAWLRSLVHALEGSFRESLLVVSNPYHAVNIKQIDEGFEPVTLDDWVESCDSQIMAIGSENWLWGFLDVIELGLIRTIG